jgi:hypothetical protein
VAPAPPAPPTATAAAAAAVTPTAGGAGAGAGGTGCPGVTWLGDPVPPEGVNCNLAGPHRTFYSAFVLQGRPAAAPGAGPGGSSSSSSSGQRGWTVRVGDYVLTAPPPGESTWLQVLSLHLHVLDNCGCACRNNVGGTIFWWV